MVLSEQERPEEGHKLEDDVALWLDQDDSQPFKLQLYLCFPPVEMEMEIAHMGQTNLALHQMISGKHVLLEDWTLDFKPIRR